MQELAVDPGKLAISYMSAILVGQLVSAMVFGVATIQVSAYYARFQRDTSLNRVVVGVLWILQVFNVCGQAFGIYRFFVIEANRPMGWMNMNSWVSATAQMAAILAAGITQACLGKTVYQLSRHLGRFMALLFCILVEITFGITYVLLNTVHSLDVKLVKIVLIVWAALGGVIDAVVAVSLWIHLRRRRSGCSSSDNIVGRMAKYAMSNGVVTVSLSTGVLITVLEAKPYPLALLGIAYGGFYNVGFFANLHSRSGLLSDKPSPDVKSLQRVLGILVTRATERASFHYGHEERTMQERLDANCPDDGETFEMPDNPRFDMPP